MRQVLERIRPRILRVKVEKVMVDSFFMLTVCWVDFFGRSVDCFDFEGGTTAF